MTAGRRDGPERGGVAACSAEIRIHLFIFACLTLPLVLLVLVPVFLALITTVGLNSLAVFLPTGAGLSIGEGYGAVVVPAMVVAACVVWSLTASLRAHRQMIAGDRDMVNTRKSPVGLQGERLETVVEDLWSTLERRARPAPELRWFSNGGLLAHAYQHDGKSIIEISHNLWRRVLKGDPLSLAILRHEMAHLVHGDLRTVRLVGALAGGAGAALRFTIISAVLTVPLLIAARLFERQFDGISFFKEFLAVAIVSVLALIALPLAHLLVRRYTSFIIALVEVRADVSAGVWGNGVADFADLLRKEGRTVASSFVELGGAHLAPTLTHLPTLSRIRILSDPELLTTPKIGYFAFSLALPWLLPATAVVNLIGGGALDHTLTSAVVLALHLAVVAMLFAARAGRPLSFRRALVVGLGLVLAQGIAVLSLAPIGYLVFHLGIAVVVPGGLGAPPPDLADYWQDAVITGRDLAEKAIKSFGGVEFFVAVATASVAIRELSRVASKIPDGAPGTYVTVSTLAVATAVSVMSSHDPWRGAIVPIFLEQLPSIFEYTWLKLSLPMVAAAVTAYAVCKISRLSGL
jgi:hypothetical protein